MFLPFLLLIGWSAGFGQAVDYEYFYEYYYDDEVPTADYPEAATQDSLPDYDFSELIEEWKKYIREKAANEKQPAASRPRPRPTQPLLQRRPRPTTPSPLEEFYQCEPRVESYRTADANQCDKYYECNIKGEESEHLCIDGYVYDVKQQNCDYPSKVDCGSRTELQTPQPSKNCPRANGFFAWPAEENCQKFWDCRGGVSYLQTCPEGVIFDTKVDACVTPDQSQREKCRAEKFLEYNCPNYEAEEPLRFGNHDRLPDPDNCQKFYTCLRDGQPRLGVCPRKTVFNNATGQCDDPKAVTGCENFWKDKETEELLDYYDYYS